MKRLLMLAFIGFSISTMAQNTNVSNAKTYDLTKQAKAGKHHDGDNIIEAIEGKYSVVLRVKKGMANQWIIKDSNGKEFQPQSVTQQSSQNARIKKKKDSYSGTVMFLLLRIRFWDGLYSSSL